MRKLVCPHCGFEGSTEEFYYMQEAVLYVRDSKVLREERERPLLVICPRCRNAFFLEDPYKNLRKSV